MGQIVIPDESYLEDLAYDLQRQRKLDDEMFPEISFDEADHEYRINGVAVPSVTGIVAALREKSGASDETMEYKRQLGKAVHKAIELHERDDLDLGSMDPDTLPFFEAWLEFKREAGFQVIECERIVYSKKLLYAGTLDVVGHRSTQELELLDAKCVWAMDAATGPQTAGYAIAYEELTKQKVRRRGGVQLLRDRTYRFHPYTDRNDYLVFHNCLTRLRAGEAINSWKALHQ